MNKANAREIFQNPIVIVNFVLQIVALIDIVRKPLPWSQKWKWLPLLLVQPIGPIIYFAKGSKMLDRKIQA